MFSLDPSLLCKIFPSIHCFDHFRDLGENLADLVSLTISGGVSAMVSPVTRITRLCSWNACSIAS